MTSVFVPAYYPPMQYLRSVHRRGLTCAIRAACLSAAFWTVSAPAQNPVITAFDRNGSLAWSSSATTGYYTVQWAASLTGAWHSTWTDLGLIPANGASNYTAEVPLYYRVSYATPPGTTVRVVDEVAAVGNGSYTHWTGTLMHHPLVPKSVVFSAASNRAVDVGSGVLAGSRSSWVFGYVDYATGAWELRTADQALPVGMPLHASYTYLDLTVPPPGTNVVVVTGDVIGAGNGVQTVFSGLLNHAPVVVGSLQLNAGLFVLDDNGTGTLAGGGASGTIDYATGAWSMDLGSIPLGSAIPITADYHYYATTP